ncbi:MAG: FGGY-family carbohydrate kinase, partial [Planctomycetota bacterium]
MLPWYEPEITPKVLEPGVRRYGGLDENDAPANVRAVIEAQMMSMAVHSSWMEVDFVTVFATGGAAANREILQVMANVHDADVYQFPVGNSAALGSALRALHADLLSSGEDANWRDVIREFAEPLESSRISPEKDCVAMYKELCEVFAACERHAVGGGADPAPQIEAFRGKYSS